MTPALNERLDESQLKELDFISVMVSEGEPFTAVEVRWKRFVKKLRVKFVVSETGETEIDVSALVQQVLRDAYLETTEDLSFHAKRVEYFNDLKKQVRDETARLRKTMQEYIDIQDQRLKSVEDDVQLANIDLQKSLQKMQQTIQTMSNVSMMLHDTAMATIRKNS